MLGRIQARFGYYGIINDLLEGIIPALPAEMLSPLDSLEAAREVGASSTRSLEDGAQPGGRGDARAHAQACCWLVSARGLTITPWIPPSQIIEHFAEPERRLYLSATVGDLNDLRRRIGCPPVERVTAAVPPRQGKRFVGLRASRPGTDARGYRPEAQPPTRRTPQGPVAVRPVLHRRSVQAALTTSELGNVRRLQADNGAADRLRCERRRSAPVCAGRYDGWTSPPIPALEILPEIRSPPAKLEDSSAPTSATRHLPAPRFAQRVAQALGRCNRGEADRAAYLLWDPGFFAALGNRRGLDAADGGTRRTFRGRAPQRRPGCVVAGGSDDSSTVRNPSTTAATASGDIAPQRPPGMSLTGVRLWSEDYRGAAEGSLARRRQATVPASCVGSGLRCSALALTLANRTYSDAAAGQTGARGDRRRDLSAGGVNTFFSPMAGLPSPCCTSPG